MIESLLLKIQKHNKGFAKCAAVVFGGTVAAQVISFIMTPIVTRLYSPAEYGVLTAFITVAGLLSFGSFKYEMAIPIAEDDEETINVFALCIILLFAYILLISTILFFLENYGVENLNIQLVGKYIFLVPVSLLFLGLYKILYQCALKTRDFEAIARTSISQSLAGNSVKLIMGFLGLGSIGLLLGNLFSQSTGSSVLLKSFFQKYKHVIKKVKRNNIRCCFKKYKDFPMFNLPSHMITTFIGKAPIIFLGFSYGREIVGYYGLAYTVVKLPMNLIGKAVGDVFFAEVASIGRSNPLRIKKLSHKLMKKLMIVGLVPFITLLGFGPQLFSVFFGENWYQAGAFSRVLSFMFLSILVFAPISRVYEIFGKQKVRFVIDLVRAILVIMGFALSYYFDFKPIQALALYSVVVSSVHITLYLRAQKILNKAIKENS